MCGIAGIATFSGGSPPEFAQIKAMCDSIVHRGPDEEGIEIRDDVGLGMRRLSIIDLEGGSQPIFNEDGSVRIVFNGEIYNFRELRRDLEERGHRFRTRSDTETIVHAYEEYGTGCAQMLNGMFAFAVHDMRRRKLLLARDHLGIKPLYYAVVGSHLIWGSEVKALLASGLIDRALDVDALAQFLAWEYIPGRATLLTQIRKLEPGHLLDIDLDRPRVEPQLFWDVPDDGEIDGRREDQWIEAVDATLKTCVERQLVSDVPLGAFLSGGVDSSLIVAAMGPARTFSIGFDDPSYNELKWSQRVAEHLGVSHRTEIIRPSVLELFHELMRFMDEPIGDFSIFPTHLVARLAREEVTVVLSGDGGDELFGGYETYAADRYARLYARLPDIVHTGLVRPLFNLLPPTARKKGAINKAKRFLEGYSEPECLSHARWRLFLDGAGQERLFTADARTQISRPVEDHIVKLFQKARTREPLNKSLYVDLKSYLCDNILVKVDRMTMANSLEARVPYLDKELVELAFRIPAKFKLDNGRTKALLKDVARRHVPNECVDRPKEGFSIPIKNWLATEFRPLLEDVLSPCRVSNEGLFNSGEVERLKAEHLGGVANHSHVLWSLIVFQSWRDMWLKG